MTEKREIMVHKTENSVKKELLSGSFSGSSFFQICSEISLPKLTGTLSVKSGATEFRFYFRQGDIIYSENSKEKTEPKILEIIKNSGLISRETFVNSEKKKSKMMRTLLEILVEDGHVSMLLYSKVISAAVRMNLLKVLSAKKGTYSFVEKKTIREVHGVKPVTILDIKNISDLADKYPAQFRKISCCIYRYVADPEKDFFLSSEKSLLQNYLVCEIDFFTFMEKAITGFAEGKWKMQSRFSTTSALQTIMLYLFRTFVLAGIILFLYLAFITGSFQDKKEPRSVEDFYFFKVELISSMLELETGQKPDAGQLINSGLLKKEEIESSGVKIKVKESN